MATNIELKQSIDTNIINKTAPSSIAKSDVGNMGKDLIDYVDQEVENNNNNIKTAGSLELEAISPYPTLEFNLNTVISSAIGQVAVLKQNALIGEEVLVFSNNNPASFKVQADQAGTSKISSGGISSTSSSLSISANISVRFIHLGNGYWKAEII